jgi:hypothetical protein
MPKIYVAAKLGADLVDGAAARATGGDRPSCKGLVGCARRMTRSRYAIALDEDLGALAAVPGSVWPPRIRSVRGDKSIASARATVHG